MIISLLGIMESMLIITQMGVCDDTKMHWITGKAKEKGWDAGTFLHQARWSKGNYNASHWRWGDSRRTAEGPSVSLNYSICRTSIKSIFSIILSITANTTLETQEFLVALYIGSQLLMMIRICINNQLVIYKWQMSGRTWNQILKNVICCFTLQVISIIEEITAYDADI